MCSLSSRYLPSALVLDASLWFVGTIIQMICSLISEQNQVQGCGENQLEKSLLKWYLSIRQSQQRRVGAVVVVTITSAFGPLCFSLFLRLQNIPFFFFFCMASKALGCFPSSLPTVCGSRGAFHNTISTHYVPFIPLERQWPHTPWILTLQMSS